MLSLLNVTYLYPQFFHLGGGISLGIALVFDVAPKYTMICAQKRVLPPEIWTVYTRNMLLYSTGSCKLSAGLEDAQNINVRVPINVRDPV